MNGNGALSTQARMFFVAVPVLHQPNELKLIGDLDGVVRRFENENRQ